MPENEKLRAALRSAAKSIDEAIQITEEHEDDRPARKDLDGALSAVQRWRDALEAGEWPGRAVSTYPPTPERMIDGTD